MSQDIEKEIFENRRARNLQNGQGIALEEQVTARDDMRMTDESQKYYRRKGTSATAGYNELQMFKDGIDPQVREDGAYVIPNKYRNVGAGQMFGYDPVSGKKVTDINSASGWGAMPRMIAGGVHDAAKGSVELGLSVAEGIGIDTGQARQNFNNYVQPEWLDKSSGAIEDVGRIMGQFLTGYGAGAKMLAKTGMKEGFKKEISASVVGGQTFDPKEGNFGTLLNDYGMLPETVRYLDSKMTESEMGEFHGRMAMVLEEVGLGGGITAATKMLRVIGKKYKGYGDKMIRDGIVNYNNATGSLNHPTMGPQGTEILEQNQALSAVTSVAHGMQINNSTVDMFMKQAEKAGMDKALAQKAWNKASSQRLDRVSGFMAQPSAGPIARQKGNINLFGGETESSVAKPADFASVAKYFDKQIARGNIQKSEMKDSIEPAMGYLKGMGIGSASPQQIIQVAKARRPEFKTITKTVDAKFEQFIHRPTDNTLVLDYKEHLFTARNDNTEGAKGYVNDLHFSEPFVKGIARTTLMGQSAGPNQLKNSKVYIQELQSDSATVARKYGEWDDKKLGALDLKPNEGLDRYTDRIAVELLGETKAKKLTKKLNDGLFDELNPEESKIVLMTGGVADNPDTFKATFRRELATPSVFNEEKAWVRQTIRPVIEDAIGQGVDKIELASSDVINKRWKGTAPHDKYQSGYPKILKQYFKGLGVPEKDIHMPTKSSDSFWVKLPKEVMEGTKKLPQYSIAGSAPVAMKFGEEDDK